MDYHFRTRTQIESLRPQARFAVLDVRGDLQALDLTELAALLEHGDAFFEGNPFVGRLLQTHPALAQVRRLSVFLAPLSKEEILFLKDPARNISLPDLVTDVMRRKLLRRTRRQKGELSLRDLENIERRAGSAFRELRRPSTSSGSSRITTAKTATTGKRSITRWAMPAARCCPSWTCSKAASPPAPRNGRQGC